MKIFIEIGCFITALTMFILALVYAVYRPTVYMSWTTKQCVCIESPKGEIEPCKAINSYDRYEVVWVE